jgi:hypothetical protein
MRANNLLDLLWAVPGLPCLRSDGFDCAVIDGAPHRLPRRSRGPRRRVIPSTTIVTRRCRIVATPTSAIIGAQRCRRGAAVARSDGTTLSMDVTAAPLRRCAMMPRRNATDTPRCPINAIIAIFTCGIPERRKRWNIMADLIPLPLIFRPSPFKHRNAASPQTDCRGGTSLRID